MNHYQNHPLAGAIDLDSAMTKLWSFYKKYFIGMYLISVAMALISSLITSAWISAMQEQYFPVMIHTWCCSTSAANLRMAAHLLVSFQSATKPRITRIP